MADEPYIIDDLKEIGDSIVDAASDAWNSAFGDVAEETEAALTGGSKAAPKTLLSFPSNLKETETLYKNCLHFSCVNPIVTASGIQSMADSYRQAALANSKNAQAKPKQEHLLDIYLYKPLMTTKLSHTYEPVKESMLADIMKGLQGAFNETKADKAAAKPGEVGMVRSAVGDTVADASQATWDSIRGTAAGVGTSIQGKTAKLINEATASGVQQTTGRAYITPSAAMYKGTTTRTQAFNFKFNPRNKNDLEEMAQIIYNFHYFSLPTWTKPSTRFFAGIQGFDEAAYKAYGSTYYEVPKLWYINEMFGSTDSKNAKRWTPRFIFGPAAITNIEYNMTPDEFSKTLKNTASDPAAVDISITFTELIPLDSQMYDAQNTNTEVHNLGPKIKKGAK